ncbi:uncharacterized protein [Physcomitrium patens]|uniref:uncharacterized protein isoform X2 n=1 Tax=Physcomitrium patens TaxID=3218 RepID=UPI003CCD0580
MLALCIEEKASRLGAIKEDHGFQDLAVNGIDDATKDMDVEREGSAGQVGKLMPLGAEAQLTRSHSETSNIDQGHARGAQAHMTTL